MCRCDGQQKFLEIRRLLCSGADRNRQNSHAAALAPEQYGARTRWVCALDFISPGLVLTINNIYSASVRPCEALSFVSLVACDLDRRSSHHIFDPGCPSDDQEQDAKTTVEQFCFVILRATCFAFLDWVPCSLLRDQCTRSDPISNARLALCLSSGTAMEPFPLFVCAF